MVKMTSYDENIKNPKILKNRFFLFLFRWPWGSRRAAWGPERRKIYILYEKKHENESCAVFRADIGGPDGKKPVKIAPAGPGPGR